MAEKKSTKGKSMSRKRAAKKVEEPKPASEIQQEDETVKAKSIKWDVVGLFSTVIPLIGTVFLFMIGWAYVSNWYAYFGVSIEQVNTPLQQVLIYSLQTIIYFMIFISPVLVFFLIWKAITERSKSIDSNDWFVILSISSLISIAIYILAYRQVGINIWNNTNTIPNEVLFIYLLGFGLVVSLLILIIFIFFVLVVNLFSPIPKNTFTIFWALVSEIRIYISVPIIILVMLAISALFGIGDAAAGRKGFGENIQKVFLVAPNRLSDLLYLEQSCGIREACTYGPFGLVAENESSFFLIKWEKDSTNRFSREPGVYIMPRADKDGAYYILPVQQSIQLPTSSTPTATSTSVP